MTTDVSPPAQRHRWLPRTLTSKLTVGVVALVFVVVTIAGGSTYVALRSFLYSRLDQQLQTTAADSAGNQFGPPGTPVSPGLRSPQRLWFALLGTDGTVVGTVVGTNVETLRPKASDGRRLSTRAVNQPLTLTTSDGHEVRVIVVSRDQFRVRDQVTGRFAEVYGTEVVGLSTDEVEHTLSRLIELELIIGAVAVLLAAFATGYFVRFSLRNLYRVTQTAQEVSAELSPEGTGLDRRVPVVEPGTEIGTLAESMNTLLATVETQFAARVESEDRMRQFLADASHELRTPLTSIRGYAELARMQGQTDGDSLSRIESEGTRMSRLVDDLLTLARSDQGARPNREIVDLDQVFDDVLAQARIGYPDRPLSVRGEDGLTVVGDHDQILRVLRNLVANAAAYTRPGGPVEIRAVQDGPGVRIEIADSGPGLSPEEAAHVFERFWRADKARTRARGGSGLGLSIVASIVQAHGGTVRFDSTVETGSTVTVWLPGAVGAPPLE